MIKTALLIAFGAVTILAAGRAEAQRKPFGYMIEAANEIRSIEQRRAVPTEEDGAIIARTACRALTQLSNDPEFERALGTLARPGQLADYRSSVYVLLDNLNEFNGKFLPAEEAALKAAGLSYPAPFLEVAGVSRAGARSYLQTLSPDAVLADIALARDRACRLASTLVDARARKATIWTFSGVVLIVVDVAAAGVSGTSGPLGLALGVPIALTSVSLGGTAALAGAKGDIP